MNGRGWRSLGTGGLVKNGEVGVGWLNLGGLAKNGWGGELSLDNCDATTPLQGLLLDVRHSF